MAVSTLEQRITLLTHNINYYESSIVQFRTECERLRAERKQLTDELDKKQRVEFAERKRLEKNARIMGVTIEDYMMVVNERRQNNDSQAIS